MQFRVLGPLEVDAGDGPVPLGGPKQRTVLANLLVRANEVVPVDVLIDEIWGDDPPGQARNTLQTYVSSLRKSLGAEMLLGRDPGYVLVVDPIDVDATRFDALLHEARKASLVDPRVAIDTLEDALAMWRGPALADVADRSLLAEAARLDELRLEAQEERIGALLAIGESARAVGELEPLVARHPLRERLWEQLLLALYREGRQADALAAFQRAREILADELGIDPSPELARLHTQILAQDPALELRGEPLRGYRLLERLGPSRTGTRFRAIQPRVERDVEVEVVDERVAATEAFAERFEPEARAVAALEHPHIVPVFDSWREPRRAYVVTRFLRGPSLSTIVANDVLETDRRLSIVEQIASAVAFAHREGVVHGAIEPSAVRTDADGNAYLGGFVIGAGPRGSAAQDLRDLAALVGVVLGHRAPAALAALVETAVVDAPPDASAYVDAVRRIGATTATGGTGNVDRDTPNPYRGLRAFTEHDAPDFFGRKEVVDSLLETMAVPGATRFVGLIGPSGCGKSSVVRAGVIPSMRAHALGRAAVLVADLSPGAHPFDALESAIGTIALRAAPGVADMLRASSRGLLDVVERTIPGDAQIVLLLDQLEELFTMTVREDERAAFLDCIRVACVEPGGRVSVIATLRADFYDRPLAYPRFGELLAAHTHALAPLQADELEQAIAGPAARAGVAVEPGLVAEMVADAAHQPGALPLVQFSLTQLFDRRVADGMTLATYRELGGIVGTLATSADDALRDATPPERQAIRQVLLRLVALGEGRPDTRRRVSRSAFDAIDIDPSIVDAALETFGRLRLLTFDRDAATREPTVEIAHEALIEGWPRFRDWLDVAREDLRVEHALDRAAQEWHANDQDQSFLLRGARLEQMLAWIGRTDLVVTREARRYLAASTAQRDRDAAAAARQRDRERSIERRSARRLRALVAVFAVAALVAGSLTLVASGQRRRAAATGEIAAARELAAASTANLEQDPELAVLLAVEAVERSRTEIGVPLPQAEEALHRAIAASRIVTAIPGLGRLVTAGGQGLLAAERIDRPGEVAIVDVTRGTARERRAIVASGGPVDDIALSDDGRQLVTIGSDGWLRSWDVVSGEELWHRRGAPTSDPEYPHRISLDAIGSMVAASWPVAGKIVLLDASDGAVVRQVPCQAGSTCQAALSPDGDRLAVVDTLERGIERGWIGTSVGAGRHVAFEAPVNAGINGPLSWSADGHSLAGSSFVWDTDSGALVHTVEDGAVATSSTWIPDGRLLTSSGGPARVWKITGTAVSSTLRLSARGGTLEISDVAVLDKDRVVTASDDTLRVWDIGPTGSAERANLPLLTEYWGGLTFTDQGDLVVAFGPPVYISDERDLPLLTSWTPGEAASTPISTGGFEAFRFDVEPRNGSVLMIDGKGQVAVMDDPAVRVLPFDTDHAAWAADGSHVVISPSSRSVALTTLEGQDVWRTRLPFPVGMLEVAPNGQIGVGAADGSDRRLVVLDGADGSVVTIVVLPGHVLEADIGSNGTAVVETSDGPLVGVDLDAGSVSGTFPADTAGEPHFALSPDGSTVAVTYTDEQMVRLYDTRTHALRMTLPAPDSVLGDRKGVAASDPSCFVGSVAFDPDGRYLAVQGCAGVRVFTLDVDELLAIAPANVTRSLSDEECRTYLHVQTCSAE